MQRTLCLAASVLLIYAGGSTGAPASGAANSATRIYFIAADEVEWEYAPDVKRIVAPGENELVHVPHLAIKKFLKAVYHEYTDATFETRKAVGPEWEHLGMLGPLIRAEVGDTIKVVFKNNTRLHCTMHPHGLSYDKSSEGALYYFDGLSLEEKKGDAVGPNESFTYTWNVPESAGPGPGDPSSILWMYHSHFVESRDINSGLLGPIIVTRKGSARAGGVPKDVDREFVVAFAVFDEGASAYFMENFVRRARIPAATLVDPNFRKSTMFYTMNGLSQGTLPILTMQAGERVRWYLMSSSNEEDVHTPHWHGQTVIANMMRTDTVNLGPMMMAVADMVPENIGTWLFHCHVNEHFDSGMLARFQVTPRGAPR